MVVQGERAAERTFRISRGKGLACKSERAGRRLDVGS